MTNKITQENTGADRIWNLIKDIPFDIFSLPNQTITKYVTREIGMEKVSPDTLYLKLRTTAVKPFLEELLQKIRLQPYESFEISQVHVYTTVKIVIK